MRQDRFDTLAGIAAPDAVDIQRGLVEILDDGLGSLDIIDPAADTQHLLHHGVIALFDSGIDQQRFLFRRRQNTVVVVLNENRVAVRRGH